MDVVSAGPLPVASILWQARPSVWVLTVVCKATFTLAPAESPLAREQEPIREVDAHAGGDPARSLREASDLAPLKQGADVVLVGHAFAPGGSPARSLVARLVVGDLDKPVQVFCDRAFTQEGELQEGPRFTRMALAYERAGGGPDTSNPAGVRCDARDPRGRIAVPNLLRPDHVVADPDDFIAPIGFGPISPSWPSRREKLGRHAAAWAAGDLLASPLPEDLDRAFFSVAPPDQRLPELRDDERILLENLHPDHPRLVTSLPGVHPRATVSGRAPGPREIAMRCDTLVIDTDRLLCTATWRGQLPLASADEAGEVRVTMDTPAKHVAPRPPPLPPRKAPAAAPPAPRPRVTSIGESTLALDGSVSLDDIPLRPLAPTPFHPAPPGPPPPPASLPATAPARRPPTGAIPEGTLDLGTSAAPAVPVEVLPFHARPSTEPPPLPVLTSPVHASPGAPVSPWAAAAPALGTSPTGMIAPAAPDAPAPETPRTIGAVLASSNAAAGVAAGTMGGARVGGMAPIAAPAVAPASRDALALVWLDRKMVPRIVRKPAWQRLLDAVEDEPVDPEADDPALSDEPSEIEDRAQVFEILDRAAATDAEGLHEALARAAGKRGKLVPPLELVEGELKLPFDEVETLKAMVSTATPLAEGDEALSGALAVAEKFLGTAGVGSAPAVAEALCARIREALAQGKHGRAAEAVGAQVERALLEQRHYQKRKVLGGVHLRGLLHTLGAGEAVVVYLPAAIAEDLPLAARFRARVLGAVHAAVDEREAGAVALLAAAVGRVVQVRRGR